MAEFCGAQGVHVVVEVVLFSMSLHWGLWIRGWVGLEIGALFCSVGGSVYGELVCGELGWMSWSWT